MQKKKIFVAVAISCSKLKYLTTKLYIENHICGFYFCQYCKKTKCIKIEYVLLYVGCECVLFSLVWYWYGLVCECVVFGLQVLMVFVCELLFVFFFG